ncbi:MAG: hypothetical protein A2136_07315 [Chloroflexi bacterium RBG_16_54_11]|nr:MAG: hypothetical protein A2136_07315 [Chloroflexi bacterium RBG_16_54_11]
MDLGAFRQLLSPSGLEVLASAEALEPREADFLVQFQTLTHCYPPELARVALEVAILRREARSKFPFADRLFLTREALEQASSFAISSYRAERYRPFTSLVDLGCSVGADTFALSKIAPTLGLELDPVRLSMASANLRALGLSDRARPIQADLLQPLPIQSGSAALFFDPARRSGHRRHFSVQQYHPPLSIIKGWLPDFPSLGVKTSPGVDLSELTDYQAEVEFISLHGELKEAVLWFGALKTAHRRATILPGPHQLAINDNERSSPAPEHISEPKSYLYEPDPAIIRAGLVTGLAKMLDASQIDPDIAYLTSGSAVPTPFARLWTVMDWFPFQLKRLRAYLRQRDVGHVTVKKRGSPLEPDFLIHQLRLKGDQDRVLVLTHLRGEPIVIICNGL